MRMTSFMRLRTGVGMQQINVHSLDSRILVVGRPQDVLGISGDWNVICIFMKLFKYSMNILRG